MQVRPVTPEAAVDELVDRITAAHAVRVLIDGAAAAEPGRWADALVEPLRLLGHPVFRASAADFVRPASVRLEYGRQNAHSLLDGWYDVRALRRELLEPLADGGSRRVLLRWWDAEADRSFRDDYVPVPDAGVLVLDGSLTLGLGLPVDFTVHLHLSPAALRRRTPPHDEWTLPAYDDYAATHPADAADVVLLVDHPDRPALR